MRPEKIHLRKIPEIICKDCAKMRKAYLHEGRKPKWYDDFCPICERFTKCANSFHFYFSEVEKEYI